MHKSELTKFNLPDVPGVYLFKQGRKVIAKGTPEEVADTNGSYTGEYLAKALKRRK